MGGWGDGGRGDAVQRGPLGNSEAILIVGT